MVCHPHQGVQDKRANSHPKFHTRGTRVLGRLPPGPRPLRVCLEEEGGDGDAAGTAVSWTWGDFVHFSSAMAKVFFQFSVFKYSEGSCTSEAKLLLFYCFRGRMRTVAGGLDTAGRGCECRRAPDLWGPVLLHLDPRAPGPAAVVSGRTLRPQGGSVRAERVRLGAGH